MVRTGELNVLPNWIDYGITSTIVGMASFSVRRISYMVIGKICFVEFNINGIGNATTFSFTLPFNSNAGGSSYGSLGHTYDNGSFPSSNGTWHLNNGSNICHLDLGPSGQSTIPWTASGNRNAYAVFFYPIA